MTSTAYQIIGIAWFSCLLVSFYIDRCIKRKLPIRKPFGCEKCMAFWIGCLYFYSPNILQMLIFASITSLTASLSQGIINYVNRG